MMISSCTLVELNFWFAKGILSLINAAYRNAVVDPCWGWVIQSTLLSRLDDLCTEIHTWLTMFLCIFTKRSLWIFAKVTDTVMGLQLVGNCDLSCNSSTPLIGVIAVQGIPFSSGNYQWSEARTFIKHHLFTKTTYIFLVRDPSLTAFSHSCFLRIKGDERVWWLATVQLCSSN